ncbi:PTS system mannose/fructose/sorbose family transporter subunit IID [Collinsella intestinalis]|uniref:PTS system mannose/fructose/sorbose family transporter subunit IID n=1 Tax=Collinsella intestinalis TaxID=147207 RepID=UPI0019561406|nr:PTS system mannose/fructose/sorbose family transporter subunit IID [Collinsella intestinalis]MBM6908142.1 PTS system mannose/fructose/sorbose family transporter subunit IID [Collinsella intestinalis]
MTSNVETKQNAYDGALTKSDLLHMATNIGALGTEYSWNYPRQMHISFALMMNPLLKKIYKDDPEGYKSALSRHMEFFNVTPQLQPFVGGIVASMEERVAKGELEPAAISSVKAALMGPLSGIGDSVFLSCIRVIAVAVGISLMTMGNPLGPIAYFLIYNVPAFLVRFFGATKGYELGFSFLEQAEESGLMSKVIYAAGIVGIMVIGAMTVSLVSVTIPIQIGASVTGDSVQTVQDILNSILPGILPLCALGIYYGLLKKNVSPMIMILVTMILGIVGVYFGFLA